MQTLMTMSLFALVLIAGAYAQGYVLPPYLYGALTVLEPLW